MLHENNVVQVHTTHIMQIPSCVLQMHFSATHVSLEHNDHKQDHSFI